MPKVKRVENRIENLERFRVAVYYHRAGDVRSDKSDFPSYPFKRATNGDSTVADWKRRRFRRAYPGYDVEVLDPRGYSVSGTMKLSTLRKEYDAR